MLGRNGLSPKLEVPGHHTEKGGGGNRYANAGNTPVIIILRKWLIESQLWLGEHRYGRVGFGAGEEGIE